jgi:hypothetical protein
MELLIYQGLNLTEQCIGAGLKHLDSFARPGRVYLLEPGKSFRWYWTLNDQPYADISNSLTIQLCRAVVPTPKIWRLAKQGISSQSN